VVEWRGGVFRRKGEGGWVGEGSVDEREGVEGGGEFRAAFATLCLWGDKVEEEGAWGRYQSDN
jgi:hypothetical protein